MAKRDETERLAKAAKRLTDDEIDRIVELKLNRIPVRQIAERVGCAPNTVTLHWHHWLDETAEERREQLERKRSEVLGRLDSVATLARQGAIRARGETLMDADQRSKAEARYLAEERQALRALSTVAGWDAPMRVGVSFDTMTDDEAAEILAELDALDG